jgi:hypothetical protein
MKLLDLFQFFIKKMPEANETATQPSAPADPHLWVQ